VSRITVMGAGDMGTALVTPLAHNDHQVRLWGTERDGLIIEALRSGNAHPRLGISIPTNVRTFTVKETAEAFREAEVIVVAITSDSLRAVLSRLAPLPGVPQVVVTVAKGFDAGPDGHDVQLLPDTISEFIAAPVVAVGGPSKANEVARGLPTAVVFGSLDTAAVAFAREIFATPQYRIEPTDDITGLEVAAAMKNAYAIALGVADGLEHGTGLPHHNLRAALFPRAVTEMGALARALGGRAETVFGLAGAGDLQVTITSGRNRLLGERIGRGDSPADAVQALASGGTTVEGYRAADFGYRFYRRAIDAAILAEGELPLLDALWRVLYCDAEPAAALWGAV
jgi:glycerol-3-phosphate dehydrogenase (NAD(P)+)